MTRATSIQRDAVIHRGINIRVLVLETCLGQHRFERVKTIFKCANTIYKFSNMFD